MSANPTQDRAQKAAEEIWPTGVGTYCYADKEKRLAAIKRDQEHFATIIARHFEGVETVNQRLVETLKEYLARCPECGGTGVGRTSDGDPYQCQWCDSGLIALATAETQPSLEEELAEALRALHDKQAISFDDFTKRYGFGNDHAVVNAVLVLAKYDEQKGQR